MTRSCLEVTEDGGVAHVRLVRAEQRNTITPAFWTELREVAQQADATGRTRALVISSTGTHFSAGLDLGVLQDGGMFGTVDEVGRQRAQVYAGITELQRTFTALEEARFPVLAAIQGGCVGGAVALAAACDLRFASDDAFFLLAETNLGITADVGQLQRLPRVLPEGLVRELAYRGQRLGAARAEQVGFVNARYPDHDALVSGTLEIAAEIAARSPLAVWGAKQAIDHARDHSVADGLDRIALWQAAMYHRTDAAETLAAKAERRVPSYDDLPPLG